MGLSTFNTTFKYLNEPLDIAGSYNLIIGGKGGVGKSFVARMLAEIILYGLHSGDIKNNIVLATEKDDLSEDPKNVGKLRFFDVDPVNHSFQKTFRGIAKRADIFLGRDSQDIDSGKLDYYFMPDPETPKETRIFDIGSNQYQTILKYFAQTYVVDTFEEDNRPLIFHVPLCGFESFKYSMECLVHIFYTFNFKAKIIYWVNDYSLLRESEKVFSIETFLEKKYNEFKERTKKKTLDPKNFRSIEEIYEKCKDEFFINFDEKDLDTIFYNLYLITRSLKYQIILANTKSSDHRQIRDAINIALGENLLFVDYLNNPSVSRGDRNRLSAFFFKGKNCIFREVLETLQIFFHDFYNLPEKPEPEKTESENQ